MFDVESTMQWGSWLVYAQHERLAMLLGPGERISPLFAPAFVPLRANQKVAVQKRGAVWLVQHDLRSPKMRWAAAPDVTAR